MAAVFQILRFHIVCIASLATLCFGWLLTGHDAWLAAAACALDWTLVNVMNRVADLAEDRINGVPGVALIERHGRVFTWAASAALVGSLALGFAVVPALAPHRIAFHAIGLAYNFKLLPTRRGWTRLKETYVWKNVSSAGLFVLSCLLYPAAVAGFEVSLPRLLWLCAFFFPLELTYEIIYDLRDIAGDKLEDVPTLPVVHGQAASFKIVEGLLAASAAALVAGFLLGGLRFRELLLLAAVAQQALFFELRVKRKVTQADCVLLTYLGAAQVLSFQLWAWAGLPLGPP